MNVASKSAMRGYRGLITACDNRKGVLDIDSVKGCSLGMARYPHGGCYGLCYAAKMAKLYGYDFAQHASRELAPDDGQLSFGFISGPVGNNAVYRKVATHSLAWFRIGVMGDPSQDWELTALICEWLHDVRVPVIVTKHWIEASDSILERLASAGCVLNTSVSALDTREEIEYRLEQTARFSAAGCRSLLRIVSCKFGDTENGRRLARAQSDLFRISLTIDNPLRIPSNDSRVLSGDIVVTATKPQGISQFNPATYIGKCADCPDQCGVLP
jgi:hypothetical protein